MVTPYVFNNCMLLSQLKLKFVIEFLSQGQGEAQEGVGT